MSHPLELETKVDFHDEVLNLLVEQSFTLSDIESAKVQGQLSNNHRYITVTGEHIEDGIGVNRFIKIPAWKTGEMEDLFKRQVIFSKFLKSRGIRTREVIVDNLDPKQGLPFAIMETFDKDIATVGLISQFNCSEMLALTPQMAHACIDSLTQLHEIDVDNMPKEVIASLRDLTGSTDKFFELMVRHDLEKRVGGLDTGDEMHDFATVLDRRLGVKGIHKKVIEFINSFKEIIKLEESGKKVLFHGDYAPDNLYFRDDNTVELLDLEWAGIHDNEALATIIDYGNLRARVWNNPDFQNALDGAVMDKYRNQGKEELGKAIVALAILRSDIEIGGSFENYPRAKQSEDLERNRRRSIEQDLIKAFELAGITLDTNEKNGEFIPAKGYRELVKDREFVRDTEEKDLPIGKLLEFDLGDDSEHLSVYNPSPMEIDGVLYLWGRVEDKRIETGSYAMIFKEGEDGKWRVVEGAPVFDDLQDPFYCGIVDGEHVFGGVQIYNDPNSEYLGYRSVFYSLGDSNSDILSSGDKSIKLLATGPSKMKGIRIIQIEDGVIGVFTRPQGDFGGRGKMAYFEIKTLSELELALSNSDLQKNPSTFIYGLFTDGEWGGPGQLDLLDDGKIGVIGHIAGFSDETYINDNDHIEHKKDYVPIAFEFDRKTHSVSNIHALATIRDVPRVKPKNKQFGDIMYSGGIVPIANKLALLALGIGDIRTALDPIKDPWWGRRTKVK